MRTLCFQWLLISTSLCCAGCTVPWLAARTLFVEPAQFPRNIDHNALCLRANRLAQQAWKDTQAHYAGHHDDYRQGFIAGYADFVQFGGNGEPPPVPPRCYWAQDTPAGRQGAVEWFAGFRQGAKVAQQSGVRELITLPATGEASANENAAAAPLNFVPPPPRVAPLPVPLKTPQAARNEIDIAPTASSVVPPPPTIVAPSVLRKMPSGVRLEPDDCPRQVKS